MSFFKTKTGIVFVGFMLIAGYQLITEHGAHLAPYAPWLILLACPIMHLFMHHGHQGNGQNKADQHDEKEPVSMNDTDPKIHVEHNGYSDGN